MGGGNKGALALKAVFFAVVVFSFLVVIHTECVCVCCYEKVISSQIFNFLFGGGVVGAREMSRAV